jgi:glycosyltransferase involved in cell wall biosynthesis
MKLSLAIATYNEEKNILRCLKSVYDWVDEIVIVDGTSNDRSVEMVKEFDKKHKIKIFIEDNPQMFHINKQKAIERCSDDWILQLDADEVVSEELKKEITNLKLEIGNYIAFWLPRLNFFLGRPLKKGGQYPDYTLRLYRNGIARFPCKSVHEQVEIFPSSKSSLKIKNLDIKNSLEIRNLKLEIGYLKSPLLHYPYPTFSEYLNKWTRYNSLEAQNLKKQGLKPSVRNFVEYIIILPIAWFFKTYFRHLGFLDGFPGFVFSLFSAIRYWGIYVKIIKD